MSLDINNPLGTYFYFVFLITARFLVIAVGAFYLLKLFSRFALIEKMKLVKSSLPKGQLKREALYSMSTIFIFSMGGVFNFYVNNKGWGKYYPQIQDYGWTYWWFTVGLMIVLNDLHFYLTHRLLHWGPLYKKIHVVHHLSKQTTAITSHAFHPVEALISMSIAFIIPFIFPLHISAYITFTTLALLNNVYGHCGFEFWPKKWIRSFPLNALNTSTVHSWHHEKSNGNFGLYTTLWDKLFGTYKNPN